MRAALLTVGFFIWIAIAFTQPAASFGLGKLGAGTGKLGSAGGSGSGVAPTTRLRITNTGAFRTTGASANRSVFP